MAHLQILLFLKQIHARMKINVKWGMFEVQMYNHQPYPSSSPVPLMQKPKTHQICGLFEMIHICSV